MKQAHCRTAADIGVDHDKIFIRCRAILQHMPGKAFYMLMVWDWLVSGLREKKLLAIGNSTTGITY
ncbi:MAG TPA: hypothetical protein VIM59_06535 [Cellvibrio sp.]